MTNPLTFSDSIVIAATPEEIYDAVSDVTRTGEWSPVCKECWWDEGDGPWVGAHFTGRNITPDRTWETRSEVIEADPGKSFRWSVAEGRVIWGYSIQHAEGGTNVTESWEFTPKGQDGLAERYGERAAERVELFRSAAIVGIPATLQALKQALEREAVNSGA